MIREDIFIYGVVLFFRGLKLFYLSYVVEYKLTLYGLDSIVTYVYLPINVCIQAEVISHECVKISVEVIGIAIIKQMLKVGNQGSVILIYLSLGDLLELGKCKSLIPECILNKNVYLGLTLIFKLASDVILVLLGKSCTTEGCEILSLNVELGDSPEYR